LRLLEVRRGERLLREADARLSEIEDAPVRTRHPAE
jgi:hypothetical protein